MKATPPRIRIAFCIDTFVVGGTELNAVRTAEAIDLDRFELYICHLQADGQLRARYEKLGVTMMHFPIPNFYSPQTFIQGIRFAKQLWSWDIDVVHTHDIYTNIFFAPWARLSAKCPILSSRRWWKEAPRSGLNTLNRLCYRLSNRVLANSTSVAGLLAKDEHVPEAKIVEIPNFLGENAFESVDDASRLAQLKNWGIPEDAFVVGVVARLAPVKNHALLLIALSRIDSRFHLVLVGDGPSRPELELLAHQLKIESRVHFAGEIMSRVNQHQFFDVSVLCSLHEGFPNSIIEAMAAARPIVATPVGGILDVVIDGETGLLTPLDEPDLLADSLCRLESEPKLRKRLGEAGRDSVRKKFHQTNVLAELGLLYETLANPKKK